MAISKSEVGASQLSAAAVSTAVRAIARFVIRNGGFATGVIERVAVTSFRLVLIGLNGAWTDQMFRTRADARLVCRLARVEVSDSWDDDFLARMRDRQRWTPFGTTTH
jgi:hypothetical protein